MSGKAPPPLLILLAGIAYFKAHFNLSMEISTMTDQEQILLAEIEGPKIILCSGPHGLKAWVSSDLSNN